MPKPRVYVETTIPNFYYDFRDSPEVALRHEATCRWWETAAEGYALFTSKAVRNELAAGTSRLVPLSLDLERQPECPAANAPQPGKKGRPAA